MEATCSSETSVEPRMLGRVLKVDQTIWPKKIYESNPEDRRKVEWLVLRCLMMLRMIYEYRERREVSKRRSICSEGRGFLEDRRAKK
jgi:hypothetical protein